MDRIELLKKLEGANNFLAKYRESRFKVELSHSEITFLISAVDVLSAIRDACNVKRED